MGNKISTEVLKQRIGARIKKLGDRGKLIN